LQDRVEAYEARYISRALMAAEGSVSRAARLLGLKHHASLAMLLKGRHRGLAHLRTPAERRKQSRKRARGRHAAKLHEGPFAARAVRILHAEDDRLVADTVRETLALEGWQVETVGAGVTALRRLTGEDNYDLLLLDNELPGVSGVELARAARRLEHRRHTPIVMLSAADVRAQAERAGVDAFLRKPDDVPKLAETIARLLTPAERR
jgi:CheY-like chemotaxis protein